MKKENNNSNNSKTYIIYENKLLSNNSQEIYIPKKLEFKLPNNKDLKSQIKYIEHLIEENSADKKKIEIKGVINNFEKIFQLVSQKIKNKEFKQLDENNYENIVIISQNEIIKQLLKNLENNENNEFLEKVNKFFNENQGLINEKIKKISIRKDILNKEFKSLENKFNDKKNQIEEKLTKIIKKREKTIEDYKNKKIKLESEFENMKENENINQEDHIIERKIKKLKFEEEKIKLDEKILKAKISTLKNKLKSKQIKTIEIIPFILTLGLIYWTKFSDTKYIILKFENKINKLKEKEAILEKEVYSLKEKLEFIKDNKSQKLKEISKKEDKIQKEIENIEKEIKSEEKEIKILNIEYEKEIPQFKELEEKLNIKIKDLEETKEEEIFFEKKTQNYFEEKIKLLQKEKENTINKIIEINNSLKKQKFDSKENLEIKL